MTPARKRGISTVTGGPEAPVNFWTRILRAVIDQKQRQQLRQAAEYRGVGFAQTPEPRGFRILGKRRREAERKAERQRRQCQPQGHRCPHRQRVRPLNEKPVQIRFLKFRGFSPHPVLLPRKLALASLPL